MKRHLRKTKIQIEASLKKAIDQIEKTIPKDLQVVIGNIGRNEIQKDLRIDIKVVVLVEEEIDLILQIDERVENGKDQSLQPLLKRKGRGRKRRNVGKRRRKKGSRKKRKRREKGSWKKKGRELLRL